MSDWKNNHANEACKFAKHSFVEIVLDEFALNMKFKREGLPEYGLQKIVLYIAQVVLARAKGFDPDLLEMSQDEATAEQWKLIEAFNKAGKMPYTVSFNGGSDAN